MARMGRPRFQEGRITKQGRNWRGDYYQYLTQPDGSTKRAHKSVTLGLRSDIRETEARRKLAEIIAKETHVRPDGAISLEWFINNRWLPMKKARWKASTHGTNVGLIQNQIIRYLGTIPLEQFDKFQLQTHLNNLAGEGKDGEEGLSYSVVQHIHSFLKDIFAEAQDLDYIQKSPAIRLEIPKVVKPWTANPEDGIDTGKPFLSLERLRKLFENLPNVKRPDRVIVMLAGLCAFRPGEIFGFTWQCYTADGLYVMQRVYRGQVDTPKSRASRATVPVPVIVRAALDKWKSECYDSSPDALMFATRNRTPLNSFNFLQRVLHLAEQTAGIPMPVDFRMLRRTTATLIRNYGAELKEVETVLRHSASLNFTTGTYVQAIRARVLDALNKFAEAVASNLPDVEEIKVPEAIADKRVAEKIKWFKERYGVKSVDGLAQIDYPFPDEGVRADL